MNRQRLGIVRLPFRMFEDFLDGHADLDENAQIKYMSWDFETNSLVLVVKCEKFKEHSDGEKIPDIKVDYNLIEGNKIAINFYP